MPTILRSIGRALPAPVRHVVARALDLTRGSAAALPVLVRSGGSDRAVRVFYGHRVPPLHEQAFGGMIKFQHMQRAFPNTPERFTVLYMVSSQPPRGAVGMARAARLRGVTVAWNQNGVAYPAWAGPDWRQANERTHAMLGLADHVFYQSEFCRMTTERFVRVPQRTAEVLANPVDTSFFTPGDAPTDGLVLLLGGTQYQRYRLMTALEVLARVRRSRPDATLLVTGRLNWLPTDERTNRSDADSAARRLGIEAHVTYLGPYTQREAPSIFRRAHLLIHTKYNDPSPGLVLEAMACGLPVVHSKSGGVPEFVGDDGGVGVETEISWERDIPPDPDAMAEAILRVAADRDRYARAARRRAVDRFDLSLWVERHRVVFEGLR